MINYSGISDEAGQDIDSQIRAHQELGWNYVEIRNVDGVQFTDISDDQFEKVCAKLAAAGMKVSGFGSGIANWATKISDPFDRSVETLKRAIPRMQKLDTRFIRVMSYPNAGLSDEAWGQEVVERLKVLGQMALEAGIVLTVENCDGWASVSPRHYAKFFELVDSPAVKAVYDTGNPAAHGDTDGWSWYQAAKPHLAYVHIKANDGQNHVWPDSGASSVREVLDDLVSSGYNGFVSIEPHMKAVIHEGKSITDAEAAYQTYVRYGRRLMAMTRMITGL